METISTQYSKKYISEENVFRVETNWDFGSASIEFPSDWVEVKTEYNASNAFLRIEKNEGIIILLYRKI